MPAAISPRPAGLALQIDLSCQDRFRASVSFKIQVALLKALQPPHPVPWESPRLLRRRPGCMAWRERIQPDCLGIPISQHYMIKERVIAPSPIHERCCVPLRKPANKGRGLFFVFPSPFSLGSIRSSSLILRRQISNPTSSETLAEPTHAPLAT